MTIERKTAVELAALYSQRENLQRHKERASDKNLWIGVLTRGSYTDAEQIIDAAGGLGAVAILARQAVVEQLERQMLGLDEKIKALDGEV